MLLKFLVGLLLLVLAVSGLQAQNFTISGKIQDLSSGEELIGAVVYVQQDANTGTVSNEYGFYSLSLPAGNYTLVCSYVGFADSSITIELKANQKIDWGLGGSTLIEVVVDASKEETILNRTDMGTEKLDMKEIAKLPVIFGEKDILKTIQLLPGVKTAGEGNSGFFVRGGAADQNLILLDEAPVYNASHLLGFFSTFNSDAIKDATLIKGNSPAQYGGRLASVLDIKMKEGNDKKLSVTGGIGLISSRISIEAPIQKNKSSFLIAARRTYADVFLKLTEQFKDNTLYFYDLNTKANYRINDKNRLFLSGYFGRDVLGLGDQFGINWGNTTATLRWNNIISPKLFSNLSAIYSNYDYKIQISGGGNKYKRRSSVFSKQQKFMAFWPQCNTSWDKPKPFSK
jgi:CarboxypepD_reg-like domain/TonB-dependent Receptor Plug Domain